MPTIAIENQFDVRVGRDGRTIQFRADELDRTTSGQLSAALRGLDGVIGITPFSNSEFEIRIVQKLANPEELARVIENVTRGVLTNGKATTIKVKTKVVSDDSYGTLLTDYQHVDDRLLRAIDAVPDIDSALFTAGGYNIEFYAVGGRPSDYADKLNEVVNQFYSDKLPRRELKFARVEDVQGDDAFAWRLSRRVPNAEEPLLTQRLTDQSVETTRGLVDVTFQENGHLVFARRANDFFDKELLALATIVVLRKFFEELDGDKA